MNAITRILVIRDKKSPREAEEILKDMRTELKELGATTEAGAIILDQYNLPDSLLEDLLC
jgi:hypothetical protein